MFSIVKGHHLQLRSQPPLFHKFKQLNIRPAAADHPIIQNKLDELLAKGAIKPSYGGAGFYSNACLVPNDTGGLKHILNLKQFNHYIHIPTFMMPTIRQV